MFYPSIVQMGTSALLDDLEANEVRDVAGRIWDGCKRDPFAVAEVLQNMNKGNLHRVLAGACDLKVKLRHLHHELRVNNAA